MKIDYRGWNPTAKKMIYTNSLSSIHLNMTWNGLVYGQGNMLGYGEEGRGVCRQDLVLMPYIGLDDITGKKIFENDIVELRYKLFPKRPPVRCVVWWLEYKACFRAVKSDNFIANIGNMNKYSTKVIGNTFQNPDLMKGFDSIITYYAMTKKQKRRVEQLAQKELTSS